MNPFEELVVAAVMAVGLAGVIVPVLPGLVLIGVAGLVWAWFTGTWAAWLVVAVMLVIIGVGTWFKYRVPGREMATANVSSLTWVLAGVGAVVGFFAVPIIGFVLGFVLGTFAGEWLSLGTPHQARQATLRLVRGIGKGMAIEFLAGVAAITLYGLAAFLLG